MRNFIIATAIVIAISTVYAGTMGNPQPVKVGVSGVSCNAATATNPPDGLSGDFYIVDGYRQYKGPDKVVDSDTTDRVDFPQMGRFK
jgi:hypothetical protein